MSKKKVSLYPDDRRDFIEGWEAFVLENGDLILLLAIISVLIVIVFIMIVNAQFFQSPYTILSNGGCIL